MLMPTKNGSDQLPKINAVCQGTPWAMGHTQGTALTETIHQLRDVLSKLEAFRLKQPSWLPYRLYRKLAEKKAKRYLARALAKSPESAERMAGLAAGAGLPLESVALFQAMEPTLAAADRESAHAVASACSVVGVRGSRSVTGQTILARNFDYFKLVQPYYILRRDEPAGGLRSLIFTTAPLIGAVDGINESGLCITYNYAVAVDAAPPAPTISMHIADALKHCRTVKEAAAWIGGTSRWGSGILMLADDTGDMAALELSHTRCQLRRIPEAQDVLFHSNCYQSRAMQAVQVSPSARWSGRAPTPLRGKRILESSECRDARFRELLSQQNLFDLDDLARIMADHGPDGMPSDHSICKHSDYWHTTASLQLIPAERRIRISYRSACQANYHDFQL